MPISKMQSESVNLADNFAFTGTVTGAGGGKILQVVQNQRAGANDSTASTSFVTTNQELTITPSATSSLILVQFTTGGYVYSGGEGVYTIYRGSTNLGAGSQSAMQRIYDGNGGQWVPLIVSCIDSPSTTSAVTYSLRFKSVTNTVFVNANQCESNYYAMEISG
mgnify:CR=1 FL=1